MIAVNDYIIVRKDNPPQESHGILLPFEHNMNQNGMGYPYTGTVESVGDCVENVAKNDKIVFDDLCQPWIIADKNDFLLIMKETDVIGILKNGE